jgi:DNA-binding beta-propeller fold protein YncE
MDKAQKSSNSEIVGYYIHFYIHAHWDKTYIYIAKWKAGTTSGVRSPTPMDFNYFSN